MVYGIALTGALALDVISAGNTCSRVLFITGNMCGAAGTITSIISRLSIFNDTIGLAAFGIATSAASSAF